MNGKSTHFWTNFQGITWFKNENHNAGHTIEMKEEKPFYKDGKAVTALKPKKTTTGYSLRTRNLTR